MDAATILGRMLNGMLAGLGQPSPSGASTGRRRLERMVGRAR